MRFVAENGGELYKQFAAQATKGGWKVPLTMLNPSETRLAVA